LDLEARVAAVALLRALRDISSRRTGITARRPPLLRSICLSETHFRTPAQSLVQRPPPRGLGPRLRVVPPPRGLNVRSSSPFYWFGRSLRLRSRSRVSPENPRARTSRALRSLEVFSPIDATQPRRATAPGTSTSRVMLRPRGSCPPRRLAPCERPPRYVSTGRVLGVLPSELDLAGVASASRRRFPSCDWLPDPAI